MRHFHRAQAFADLDAVVITNSFGEVFSEHEVGMTDTETFIDVAESIVSTVSRIPELTVAILAEKCSCDVSRIGCRPLVQSVRDSWRPRCR